MKYSNIFILMLMLVFSACRKDVDTVTETPDPYVPPVLESWEARPGTVNGDITGMVIDEAGLPVEGAIIQLGSTQIATDQFGHFFFSDIDMMKYGTYLTAYKPGHFLGSRRFFPIANAENRVKIQLLEKNFNNGDFDGLTGGTVNVEGGASIKFAPRSIKYPDNSEYQGPVRVATKWMDPTSNATLDQMPGNLQGVNTRAEEVSLQTFGMIAVELLGSNGEELNIADGFTAELTMPVPADILPSAPASIPLWSFNEEHGMWVEEGTANLVNGEYVGEVSHFSFWNCDVPENLIYFDATVVDENGTPLPNLQVVISTIDDASCGTGYTSGNGVVGGYIPKNEELLLEILDDCDNVIYSSNIGPFADDTALGDITVIGTDVITITGNLVDCDANTITNGVITITAENDYTQYHYTEGNSFEVAIIACEGTADFTITGVNLDDLVQSDPENITTSTDLNVGDIEACDIDLGSYLSLTVDGVDYLYLNFHQSLGGNPENTYMEVQDSLSGYIGFGFRGVTVGNYDNDQNFMEAISDWENGFGLSANPPFSQFEVTAFGDVGETIRGNFSGMMDGYDNNQQPQTYEVEGEFSVIRLE